MTSEAPKRPRGRPRKYPLPEQQVDVAARSVANSEQPDPTQAEGSGTPAALKVHIYPSFGDLDKGDGGIRRVVEAQIKHLPQFGIEIVSDPAEADVIAAHATVPSTYIKRFSRKTFVAMCHGLYWSEYEWDNWSIKANAEVMETIRVSDAVVTCSEWVGNSLRRHTSRPVEIIPHGVDTERWQGINPLEYVLWNKTRPDPVCDPTPMQQVAELLPGIQFVSSFGIGTDNVKLTGKMGPEEAKGLVERASVYLCTTRETFGIGTLEALSCGVPVVGFRWGGQAEFIDHGVDGWLVTPGDINGLAEGIKWAMENKSRVAQACREKAKRFNWDDICSMYARVFKDAHKKKVSEAQAPRTSIIVTNYNLHAYLEDALHSVAEQSDNAYECIIVDDASPDPTGREIAQRYVDRDPEHFKLIVNEENVYLAEARNIGIRQARGRYIIPLDADDMLTPSAVSLLAGALDLDRSIHVAYGNVFFVDDDGRTPTDYSYVYDKNVSYPPGRSAWPFPFYHEQQIKQQNLLPYASMYRKEAWRDTGGYRRRCRTAEDADLWTRLSSYGYRPKMVTEEDTLVYRNRKGSMSRINSSDWIRWFSWSKMPEITPAGAVTVSQLPVPSLDPIIISVVIPVGPGHEKLVTDAIDSLDTQSFRNWECILVNDTGKPLVTELPSWVRVIATTGKTGPAKARNTGIKASKGWLFLPLDADDYLEPDALKMMYDEYQESKEIIYTDFWQTSMDGKSISIHQCDDYDPYLITGKKRNVNGTGPLVEGMIHSVTALTPKAVWEKIGGYDESLSAWEDWDFQIAIGDLGICSRRIPLPLFVYRKHTGKRREQNYESFEKSKEGIIRKWGSLWNGGKELKVCQSCSSRGRAGAAPISGTLWGQTPQAAMDTSEAVLMQYTGNKVGAVSYRGPSKTVYLFGQGDTKYVLAQDVKMFQQWPNDFRIVQPEAPVQFNLDAPLLVAQGQA